MRWIARADGERDRGAVRQRVGREPIRVSTIARVCSEVVESREEIVGFRLIPSKRFRRRRRELGLDGSEVKCQLAHVEREGVGEVQLVQNV